MKVQMTDFENAAFAVFIVLLSRAIMSMNINFYIPISKACTSSLNKVIPTSRKLTLVVLGEYRLIRTCIGRNSATESIKLNSISVARYSRLLHLGLHRAQRHLISPPFPTLARTHHRQMGWLMGSTTTTATAVGSSA